LLINASIENGIQPLSVNEFKKVRDGGHKSKNINDLFTKISKEYYHLKPFVTYVKKDFNWVMAKQKSNKGEPTNFIGLLRRWKNHRYIRHS
jgi:hypothetical protein